MRTGYWDEGKNPSSVLYYAPRRRVAADGATIGPILERLSRGDRRARTLVEEVPLAPDDEPIGAPSAGAVRARAIGLAARVVAVTGAGVGAAVALAFALQEPQRADRAPLATALPAKPVHTVSYKSQAKISDDSELPAPRRSAPLQAAAHEVLDAAQAAAMPLPAALASWAMVPPALPPAQWGAAEQISGEAVATPVAPEPAERPAAKPQPHHARVHRHRHAAAAQPKRPAETPDEETEAPIKPVDNSLRSVLDKMFKPD